MLLQDIPPTKTRSRVLERREKYSHRRGVAIEQKSSPKVSAQKLPKNKIVATKTRTAQLKSSNQVKTPFWLQSLIVLNHGSSLLCYLTATAALVLYGMTVYAPKLWTQKYAQLQDLQKKERQFTSVDEMFKDELAQSATKSNLGFIKPNLTQSPIFLPNKPTTKVIELKQATSVQPKTIKPVFPIAY